MKNLSLLQLLAAAALCSAGVFGAAHLMTLESEQRETLKQLQEIKALIQARDSATAAAPAAATPFTPPAEPPLPAAISIRGAALKGRADARLTLIEFSDFECPYCGRYTRDTFDQLVRQYVDSGKVQYAFRNYPIAAIHPHALKAGAAADCARQQGKFWEMHARLFADQRKLEESDLRNAAGASGLDLGAYDRCVSGDAVAAKLRADQADAERAGVLGTPMFFLGSTQHDGGVKVLRRLSGAQPFDVFKTVIDAALASP